MEWVENGNGNRRAFSNIYRCGTNKENSSGSVFLRYASKACNGINLDRKTNLKRRICAIAMTIEELYITRMVAHYKTRMTTELLLKAHGGILYILPVV